MTDYPLIRTAPHQVPNWHQVMLVNLLDSWRGMMRAGFTARESTHHVLARTSAGVGAIANFLRVSNLDLAETLLVQTQSRFAIYTAREHPAGYCILQRAQYHINYQRLEGGQ